MLSFKKWLCISDQSVLYLHVDECWWCVSGNGRHNYILRVVKSRCSQIASVPEVHTYNTEFICNERDTDVYGIRILKNFFAL